MYLEMVVYTTLQRFMKVCVNCTLRTGHHTRRELQNVTAEQGRTVTALLSCYGPKKDCPKHVAASSTVGTGD